MCSSPDVKTLLGEYFGSPVQSIRKGKSRTKTDLIVELSNGEIKRLQHKDGHGNGRGWSIDRRAVEHLTTNPALAETLRTVCLKQEGKRHTDIPAEVGFAIAKRCITGDDPAHTPTHITHSIVSNGEIVYLAICPIEVFLAEIEASVYPTLVSKRTCVHVAPTIYFQRKGGGIRDMNPDHIQTKLTSLSNMHVLRSVGAGSRDVGAGHQAELDLPKVGNDVLDHQKPVILHE